VALVNPPHPSDPACMWRRIRWESGRWLGTFWRHPATKSQKLGVGGRMSRSVLAHRGKLTEGKSRACMNWNTRLRERGIQKQGKAPGSPGTTMRSQFCNLEHNRNFVHEPVPRCHGIQRQIRFEVITDCHSHFVTYDTIFAGVHLHNEFNTTFSARVPPGFFSSKIEII